MRFFDFFFFLFVDDVCITYHVLHLTLCTWFKFNYNLLSDFIKLNAQCSCIECQWSFCTSLTKSTRIWIWKFLMLWSARVWHGDRQKHFYMLASVYKLLYTKCDTGKIKMYARSKSDILTLINHHHDWLRSASVCGLGDIVFSSCRNMWRHAYMPIQCTFD